ncbi:MAG: ferritin family protein [Kosmotogaceae bacterium]
MSEKIISVLKFAMAREKEGVSFYEEKLERAKMDEVKDILEKLRDMEKDHVKYIRKALEKAGRGDEIVIEELKEPKIFEDREKIELKGFDINDMVGDIAILRMGYLIEKDFEDFYNDLAEKTEDESARKMLLQLSSWENEHKNSLLDLYNFLMKEYWNTQGFTPLF